ncbi:MAG: hypothetical protein JWR21_1819 [Herminiimonas sp.]|nr:hypothetical protein [Herminiimonas sp.]
MASGVTKVRRVLGFIAWVATAVLGIFMVGGLLGFIRGIVQDYTPLGIVVSVFLFSLALAIWLSRPGSAQRQET